MRGFFIGEYMINVLIYGIGGKMGANVISAINETDGVQVVCGVDKFAPETVKVPVYPSCEQVEEKVDVLIDFSRAETIDDILAFAKKTHCALVIATTGHSADQIKAIDEVSNLVPVFRASNFSLGINLLIDLAKKAANVLGLAYDVEIVEAHHNMKVDAPSGTAMTIAEEVAAQYDGGKEFVFGRHETNKRREVHEMGIHAIRGGTIVGKHDVMFIGKDEVITISHEAQSRMVFAVGAVRAAKYVAGKPAGKYNMSMMLSE